MTVDINQDEIVKDVRVYNTDLVKKVDNDDLLTDYVNRAVIYVSPLEPPKVVASTLVRLWACHLMNNAVADNVTSKKLGQITETYADTSKNDDEFLDEFNRLCNQYGLNASGVTLYGL
ncbi:DUF4054 domain-containing protein [Apilactobacillus xinyiensis]|uniref:DUF4054 domain-containing protein n=1 Tax=Apilactobacillus xinyiensis TaxID=2841032 RepID=UPI00200C7193|nr:DUF4054 domain-containing protein [Apilactobacillus xinyiensis]MCL0330861.1 hypothetical protein [Apilactobacillus xinyiensis]